MKKRFLNAIALLITVLLISATAGFPVASASGLEKIAEPEIIQAEQNSAPNKDKILEARFLNMLNHNYVYDSAFKYEESIVNDSVIALLDFCDKENDSFIAESYVKDYIFNMYGVEIADFSVINTELPKLDGFVYVIPRGYSLYEHKIDSVTLNNDGSYTVITKVTISDHDGGKTETNAISLFIKNESSQFGYNIIHCDITDTIATA